MNEIIDKDILDEKILLDTSTGNYHSLNETAAFIWNLIKSRRHIDEIAEALANEYDIKSTEAKTDIHKIIAEFESLGVLK